MLLKIDNVKTSIFYSLNCLAPKKAVQLPSPEIPVLQTRTIKAKRVLNYFKRIDFC